MVMRVIIEIDPFDGCKGCKGKVEGTIRKMKRRLGDVGEIKLLAWGDEKEKLTVLTTIHPDAIVAALMCKFKTKKITWSQDVSLPDPGQLGPPTTSRPPGGQLPPIIPTAPPLSDSRYETYYPWPLQPTPTAPPFPTDPAYGLSDLLLLPPTQTMPTAPPFPTDPTYGLSDLLLLPPPQTMPTAPSFYDWNRNPFL